MRNLVIGWCMLGLLLDSCSDPGQSLEMSDVDWPAYGGNSAGNRYSHLQQINTENVHELSMAWRYHPDDSLAPGERPGRIVCQPIVVDGTLYGTGSESRLFALDAASGEEIWVFNPEEDCNNRGLNYWQEGKDRRILYVAGSNLYAVDATTGRLKEGFGIGGHVDFYLGLEHDRFDVRNFSITSTCPGVIYKDVLVIGSTVSEYGDALPGDIRGFDVRTGELRWVFHTIPQPGEFGYDTWPKDAYQKIGGANCWAGMVLDDTRGVVYLGTGSPSVDFYGGDRAGANLFANCIIALDAITGERKWHYQTVHHDLWDLDIPCPPNLVTVQHDGKKVDAVVQTTKDGLIYVLDRDTGASLFPVEERPVPESDLPGEQPYPTQKFPLKPDPLVRQVLTEADLPDPQLFPEAAKEIRDRFSKIRHGEKFIPPSSKGIWYIGTGGGAQWGGNSVDPQGILYQNVNEIPTDLLMVDFAERTKVRNNRASSLFIQHCTACHGEDRKGDGLEIPSLVDIKHRLVKDDIKQLLVDGRGRMPSFRHLRNSERRAIIRYIFDELQVPASEDEIHGDGPVAADADQNFPYVPTYINTGYNKVRDSKGYPGIKPPWGTLNAVDLNTGQHLWQVPLGEFEELTEKGIPITGTHNFGGPVVTAGDLVFIAGTEDWKIRAFSRQSGQTLWDYRLPRRGTATPITYAVDGKQYVVIAAGGYGIRQGPITGENQYIAFALPQE
ncbi:MAG: PQQ-binding-like beta-propeller repeat protein [Saprospiraceae bacterium]|nr:PQQ-binding-like beta-propeller repeat protein [Saprospiraceae bacterium]